MKWAICVSNRGYPASLEERKLYVFLDDEEAAKDGFVRVIDESGEDYLYPKSMFMAMPVEQGIEQRLLQVA
jgi:hypothetical protein